MKKILLCWLAAATALTAGAQSNEWQDAGVNAVNRMPMHGSWFAYESPEAAQTGDKTLSERFVTLNGNWKFNWVRDADQRPTDFFRVGYNDKGWNDMPVPGLYDVRIVLGGNHFHPHELVIFDIEVGVHDVIFV